jgi:hypothetical protein
MSQNLTLRQRGLLIESLAELFLEGMSRAELYEYAHQAIINQLRDLSNSELIEEVGEFEPGILADVGIDRFK